MDSVKVCSCCKHEFRIRVSDDIGFHAYWIGNHYLIDVVLLISEFSVVCLLYRRVYVRR